MPKWSASARLQWPFVGRDTLVDDLRSLYRGGPSRGAIIEGPAGVGKTRLADEFGQVVGGARVMRCVGSSATASTPYAAIAHMLPSDIRTSDPCAARLVLEAVRSQLSGERAVVIADDVVFLDEATVALFAHLLALNAVFLVGTVRSEHTIPSGLDSLIRSYGLHRMSLRELDAASVELAARAVIGAPVEPISAHRLVTRSGGNPLYLRELLLQSVAGGSVEMLPSGEARLDIDVSSSPVLVEMVGSRLAAVPANLLSLLRMVAVAEPLTAADIECGGFTDDAVQLEQSGWIRADARDTSVEIRVAHPLHGEVLRASMGLLDYRRQVARAADLLRRRAVPERDDPLRIALWELDAGLKPSAEVLLDGARRARAAVDLLSALRLVEAAYRVEPSQAAKYIWFEVLFLLSRFEEAEAVWALPQEGDVDIGLTVSSMMLRMDNLLWGIGDSERARLLIESYRPEFESMGIDFLLSIPLAFICSVDGQSARALELLGRVPNDPTLFLLSSLAHLNTRTARGHFAEVERLCQRGLDTLQDMPDPRASMDPMFFRLNRGLARNLAGRSAEVFAEFVVAYGAVLEERQRFMRCFVGMVTGHAALNQGFLESADQWFAETAIATGDLTLPTARRVSVAGRAAVAGQRGDSVASALWLAELESLAPDVAFMHVETQVGRSWALHATGRPGDARDTLRAAIEWAIAADEPVSALCGLVEICRLGDGRWAADQLDRITALAEVEGPYAVTQILFVRACAGRSGEPLLQAAHGFDAAAAHLLAAEAASQAAAAFEREGQRRGASEARVMVTSALAKCDAANTPSLQAVPALASTLSARELEVARLASRGLTSKEIARRLYLSSRTVDNHLQRVFTKLGVTGRDDLVGHIS